MKWEQIFPWKIYVLEPGQEKTMTKEDKNNPYLIWAGRGWIFYQEMFNILDVQYLTGNCIFSKSVAKLL